MGTDVLDRIGTGLVQRFPRLQFDDMMKSAGLVGGRFSEAIPYWCAVGTKRRTD